MQKTDKLKDQELELLKRMIETPSVTGSEMAIAEVVEHELLQAGMEIERKEIATGRPMILGFVRGQKPGPVLVLNGHTDTHGVEHYQGNPWNAQSYDGCMYGRGSVDMKGGLAAMICAARRLVLSGGLQRGMLIVAAVPDEEMLSQGTSCMVQYLKQKGIHVDFGIVGEPTGLRIGRAMRGVSHIDIKVKGYSQHTSHQNHGGNAIVQMGRVLTMLEKELTERYRERKHPLLGTPVFNVGLISGGEKPNVVAETCKITILRRDLPGEELERVMEEIRVMAQAVVDPGCSVEVTESPIQKRPFGGRRLPMELSEENQWLAILQKTAREVLGSEPETGMVPFWCDASIMMNEGNIPTVVWGPGDIACAHSPKEWIDLDQYELAVDLYENVIRRCCC